MIYKKIYQIVFILSTILLTGAIHANAQDTLKLDDAVLIGLENNFDIKISKGQKEILSNNNTLGNAGFLPTVDLNAAQRYTVENTDQTFISGDEQNRDGAKSNNFTAGAVLNWTLFDGTTMFYTKDRLGEMEKMGIAQTESVIQNIVAQIAVEFYSVALDQLQLNLLKENISLSEDRLEIAKNKWELGKSSKMEYLQAQVDLNNDISNHLIQQERLATEKTTLNELLGRDVTQDFYAAFEPNLNTDLKYDALQADMETINPELLAVRYEANAAQLVQKELFGQRVPELGVNVGYNYARSEAQAGFLLNRQSSGVNYGVSATWNVFNGFNLNRQIQNARILAENSELNFEAMKLSLNKTLYASFIRYQNNIQLHKMEEENREVARENNDIAMERYRVGNSSPLEFREAQINLLGANLRFLNAAYNVKTGEIELMLLSGKLMK